MKYLDIISAFQGDLKKGLSVLFETYGQTLYGFTMKHWPLNEDEGYDVLYKTLETVGKVITRYEFSSENHFINWLFKIHKNNILMLLRSKRAKENIEIPVDFESWENEAKQLEDENFDLQDFKTTIDHLGAVNPYENTPTNNQLMMAMQKGLQLLSEEERDLLLLRMNNYSYEEIATMLGIENSHLKVKFNRAKAKLEKKTLAILKDIYHETAK